MPFITTPDGTEIFYKDWGTGQPIVFSHGWPLSAALVETKYTITRVRGSIVVSHERRGHGGWGGGGGGAGLDGQD